MSEIVLTWQCTGFPAGSRWFTTDRYSPRSQTGAGSCRGRPASRVCACVGKRRKATKLRIWRVCQGCLIGWLAEAVGAGASAGEEAQLCPFTELGEHVAGFDL